MSALAIVSIFFSAGYVLFILFYLWGWFHSKEEFVTGTAANVKISVILPVRNEEKNLGNILHDLSEQQYNTSLFEIIVVDDFSTDGTSEIVRRSKLKNISLLSLQEILGQSSADRPNKKIAIETAVKKATGELIVTTDADCHPGSHWLLSIADFYSRYRPVMIAGPVNYFYDDSFLGKFQTLDFLSMVGIAAASIKNGFYNLCNGANLAYTKEAFTAVGGYSGNEHIASGDDMMLMHKMAKKFPGRIRFLRNRESIVFTSAEKDLSSFWRQRVRWASKSTHYEDKRITAILSFAYIFHLLLLVNLLTGLFIPFYLKVALWQFMVKIIADTFFLYPVTKFFRRENILWLFLPIELAHVLYILLIAPASVFGKYEWKGRKM